MVQRGRVIDRAMVNCQKMTSDRVFIVAQSRRVARLGQEGVPSVENKRKTGAVTYVHIQ